MKRLVIGMTAHVDAGKTTLSDDKESSHNLNARLNLIFHNL